MTGNHVWATMRATCSDAMHLSCTKDTDWQSHLKTLAQCLTSTETSTSKDLKTRNILKLDFGSPVSNFLALSFSIVFGCVAEELSNYYINILLYQHDNNNISKMPVNKSLKSAFLVIEHKTLNLIWLFLDAFQNKILILFAAKRKGQNPGDFVIHI